MNKRYRLGEIEEAVSEMEELIDTQDDIAEIDDDCRKRLVCVCRKAESDTQTGSCLYLGYGGRIIYA